MVDDVDAVAILLLRILFPLALWVLDLDGGSVEGWGEAQQYIMCVGIDCFRVGDGNQNISK